MSGSVRVGVTGHRLLAEVNRLAAGVAEGLNAVAAAFPGKSLEILSALAEGADRLVVLEALARGCIRLVVPLPLPVTDYLLDFETPESQVEFRRLLNRADEVVELPPSPTRDEAYRAAGLYVLEHCDVLLAVWDGRAAQGRGGTEAVVAEARRRALPLVWVHAGNRRPGTREPTTLGAEQGVVIVERLGS